MIILSIFQFHNLFLHCNPLKVVKKIIEYLVKSDASNAMVYFYREKEHTSIECGVQRISGDIIVFVVLSQDQTFLLDTSWPNTIEQ